MTGGQPTAPSSDDDEAERLWLARLLNAPESWRSRANNAAGLLSAAAAATLAGVLLGDSASLDDARKWAFAASVFYVLAVVAFLLATVMPAPAHDESTFTFTKTAVEYCRQESKRIKLPLWVGCGCAVLAIVGSAASLHSAAYDKTPSPLAGTARLAFNNRQLEEAVRDACPDLIPNPRVRVVPETDSSVRLSLLRQDCGAAATVTVEASLEEVILRYGG